MPKALLILLPLLTFLQGRTQSYYFTHYQVDDGLAHNTVVTIIQDSKGFMWVGTKGGLSKWDGYTFKTIKNKNNNYGPIGDNVINALYEDQGILFIGTERGVFSYDTYTETLRELPGDPYASTSRILPADNGDCWLLTNGELLLYHRKANTISPTGLHATCMTLGKHGNIWMGHDDGSISLYDPRKNTRCGIQIIDRSLQPNLRMISNVLPIDDSTVLIGTTKQGLKSCDPRTGKIVSLFSRNGDSTEIYVRDIVATGKDECWVATESGIYIYNFRTRKGLNLRKRAGDGYSLTDNAVYTLCRDSQGGVWAGTFFGGINYFSPENARFSKYYPLQNTNSISGNAVREICSDVDDNIWIGTEDAGIDKLDPRTGVFTHYTTTGKPSGLSYPNIHGMLAVGGRLFIGPFQHGMEIMDIHTGNIVDRWKLIGEPDSMHNDFIMTIRQTADSTLLVGTTGSGGGLYTYDVRHRRFSKCRQVPPDTYVYDLLEDHQGTIWTGSLEKGTFWFNRRTGQRGNIRFAPHTTGQASHDTRINGVFEDSNHNIWFTTEGAGLIKLAPDRKSFKRLTMRDGLPSNNLFRTLEDNNHHLWISSLKGLICLDLTTDSFIVYTRSNGLITDQFNYNSAFKDHAGRMYFGSVKGMIAFNPGEFRKASYTPPIYITGFQINNREMSPDSADSPLRKSILYTDTITLSHDQSTFSIEFAALNYPAPAVTRYSYFMKGLDKSWTWLNSNRKAYFTGLAPGNYTFIVRAESNIGSWKGKETRLFIRINAPFWASTWAWLFYFICAGLILWTSIRQYHRHHKNKTLNRLRLFEHEKEKEIYEAKIDFFTNIAHEIRTPLTLILGPLELLLKRIDEYPSLRKSLLMMDKNGKRLLELTNQLLDFRRTEADQFGLSFVNVPIGSILKEQVDSFRPEADRAGITLSFDAPANNPEAFVDKEAFTKICGNLISNAIKYADSKVNIRMMPFHPGEASFSILFTNDGREIPIEWREKIFQPFIRLRGDEKAGTGIGLPLARSLTELHNGTLRLVSADTDSIVFELKLPVHQPIEFHLNKWENIQHNEGQYSVD